MSESARIAERTTDLVLLETVPYPEAVAMQEAFTNAVAANQENEKLILLQHPPVITLGRGFHQENLLFSKEWLQNRGIAAPEVVSGRLGWAWFGAGLGLRGDLEVPQRHARPIVRIAGAGWFAAVPQRSVR